MGRGEGGRFHLPGDGQVAAGSQPTRLEGRTVAGDAGEIYQWSASTADGQGAQALGDQWHGGTGGESAGAASQQAGGIGRDAQFKSGKIFGRDLKPDGSGGQ